MKETPMQLHQFKLPVGLVIYEGPSVFDGKDIVVIANGFGGADSRMRSHNSKTGAMIQTWILRADDHPIEHFIMGDDDSICGDCKHSKMNTCYVNLMHGPAQVYKAYKRGTYQKANAESLMLFKDSTIRLGAYGDPAAVPMQVWESILGVAKNHTAYTHAWKNCDPSYKKICMASCDTNVEVDEAIAMGWTPFFAADKDMPMPENSFICPASKEADQRLSCGECMACNGGEYNGKRGYPIIRVHGSPMKMGNYSTKIERHVKLGNKRKSMRALRGGRRELVEVS